MRRKFIQHQNAITQFDRLWAQARCVPDVRQPADDADRRLVIAADAAGVNLFVTGDARVLQWRPPGGMRIMSPREAWTVLATGSSEEA